jgi:plastocyanin
MTLSVRGAMALAIMVAGGVACGGGSTDSNPPPPLQSTVILSAGNQFLPRADTVRVGGTITWTWAANAVDHNIISTGANTFTNKGTAVTPGNGTDGVDFFDQTDPNATHQFTFNTAGTYGYYCSTHGTTASATSNVGMGGQIFVLP